ncbi:PPE domain-containing protein [Saccharothrix isguenensis]
MNRDEYYSKNHKPSAAARRRGERRVRQRRANRQPENFGKINWNAYTHRTLWDMVKSADTARMTARMVAWRSLADEVDQATADVQKIVQQLVVSWRGPSAVAAAGSASRLTEWAADASKRACAVGSGLDAYTSAVDEAARRMPEPVHPDAERWFRDGYDVTTLDGPQGAYMLDQLLDDHMPSKKEQQAARAEAVRVMEEYESASRGVHTTLPTFDNAPGVTRVEPDHRPVSPPLPPPSPLPVPPVVPPAVAVPTPGVSSGEGTTSVAAAVAPAVGASTGGQGTFGVPGGGVHGGISGGVHGVPGSGHGGYGGGSFGPIGSGGASGVLGAVPGGAAARGGIGPVVGAGGPQGFGMYPPMAPGNREEDAEHRNRYDNGLDLLDDLPPAFPPVLGE